MSRFSLATGALILAGLITAAGCETTGRSGSGGGVLRAGIPPKAQQMQEGSGQLVHTADQAGRVFLYDATNDRVVERYQVRKGQRFAVDAVAGRATLEGNEVSVGKLKKGARSYQIFFLPDNQSD